MIIIVAVLVGLATIATALRLVARLKRRVNIEIDDYLCFTALFLLYGMLVQLILCGLTHVLVQTQLVANIKPKGALSAATGLIFQSFLPKLLLYSARSNNTPPPTHISATNHTKIFIANQFTYFALCPVIKISIICFYRRIFAAPTFHRISAIVNWLIGLWAAVIFLICALQCRPLRGYWDKSVDAKCIDGTTYFIVNQTFNVVMDFVILGLPLPIIWRLKRSWQDKLALSFVFTVGGLCVPSSSLSPNSANHRQCVLCKRLPHRRPLLHRSRRYHM